MFLIRQRISKILQDLAELIYLQEREINSYRVIKTKERFTDIANLDVSTWDTLLSDELWGGHQEYFWFETTIKIPEEFAGQAVEYKLITGREDGWDAVNPQFSVYINGSMQQGMDINHNTTLLTECAAAGDTFRIVLSAFTGDHNLHLSLKSYIRSIDRQTEKYYYDLKVPYDTAMLMEEDSDDFILIIKTLNNSINLLDLRKEHSDLYYASLSKAQAYIEQEFYQRLTGQEKARVYCVGHTHIDVAWQWTLAVTRDKAVRSFSTVLELMRRYPEYKFMSSQPQLYQYVKEDAPEVYQEIKERVKEGRWEAEGGMWVEADCNIASGESLVRQFMYGISFFQNEFGVKNKILWLPDVFGYSAALPQIMKKCGIEYFMTTKISWNECNRMPYDTFMWEGIDGTSILTHFSPSRDYQGGLAAGEAKPDYENDYFTTYNAFLKPLQVKGAWQRYSQKKLNQEVLMCYGYGDGGGGTTPEQIENERRTRRALPGLPCTKMSTATEFFEVLRSQVKDRFDLPKWVGELYLEYHRGTYTSMARNKRDNRKSEFCYQNLELFSVFGEKTAQVSYPSPEIRDGWRTILLNQFHDILPGSSIKEVYDESAVQYQEILTTGNKLIHEALAKIVDQLEAKEGAVVVFNPNSHKVTDVVEVDGKKRMAYDVPGKGYKTFTIAEMEPCSKAPTASKTGMENQYFQIQFNEKGQFSSIYDKLAERELLAEASYGNVIMSYEDRPHNYDAWDINHYYKEKCWEVDQVAGIEVLEEWNTSVSVKISRNYLDSFLSQTITIYSDIPRIDIKNYIDWKEHQILLKALFPLDLQTNEATFEIQYGNVKRATHQNTSWDFARFEVCVHKWLDVAENGYGVSFINDSKYGVSIQNHVVGLTMLKSGIFPNPTADQEIHEFTYSIFAHTGDFREAGTIGQAYQVNNPLLVMKKKKASGTLASSMSLVSVNQKNVVIEVVKKAEADDGTMIRLYECWGRRSNCQLQYFKEIKAVSECDLLENTMNRQIVNKHQFEFQINPYEIKTYKLQ